MLSNTVAIRGYLHLIKIKNPISQSQLPPLPHFKGSVAICQKAQMQNISITAESSTMGSTTLENVVLCKRVVFIILETNLHLIVIIACY